MRRDGCAEPLPRDLLIAWWLGELDEAAGARIEEHLFGCGACSEKVEEIARLAGGIRALVRSGRTRTVVAGAFPRQLAAAGLQVREYRVARNGSVNCTVAPDDDVMVARLQAPLAGVDRIDLLVLGSDGAERMRLEDVPFDASANEVVLVPDIAELRTLPVTTQRMRLVAVGRDTQRVIGEYAFHHTPWAARAER